MEAPLRSSEREINNPLLRSSPSTPTAASAPTTSPTTTTNIKGLLPPPPPPAQGLPPLTPRTIARSEANPFPTTFVQADTASFKQVVQMLTGSSDTAASAARSAAAASPPPPPAHRTGPKKQPFKLYERRQSGLRGLKINPLVPGLYKYNNNSPSAVSSPRNQEVLSPSLLDFPSLVLSPVTPLNPDDDPFDRASSGPNSSEEDRAIAEKGFFLHPSPRAKTGEHTEPPRLLPLFPLTSPRLATAASSSSAPPPPPLVAAAASIVPVSSSVCSSTTS